MRVREFMTHAPVTCAPGTTLRLVAQMMAGHDCAAIPIVDSGRLAGIITDRDITCRAVAFVDDAAARHAADFMTQPVLTVGPDDTFETASELMAENHIHHLPVIGPEGNLLGIVAESDLGRLMSNREFGALARGVSIRRRNPFPRAGAVIRRSRSEV